MTVKKKKEQKTAENKHLFASKKVIFSARKEH
jgi:hypothetical protein